MQFPARKKFFRGIVQFFSKKGAFESNLRPKSAASLWYKVPHFYDYSQHINIFPNIPIVQNGSSNYAVSSQEKIFCGIVQFFSKKGVFDGNLRPKYAASLCSKFLTSMIVLSTYKCFPKHAHSAKCSPGKSVSSQENFFSAA